MSLQPPSTTTICSPLPPAVAVMLATPALAGKSGGLVAGGNTIAGPGSVTALLNNVNVLADGVNEDVCVTVGHSGNGVADVTLDLTDEAAGVVSTLVAARDTTALCQGNHVTVQTTCMAVKSCPYYWREPPPVPWTRGRFRNLDQVDLANETV